jgi:hypothetical protein
MDIWLVDITECATTLVRKLQSQKTNIFKVQILQFRTVLSRSLTKSHGIVQYRSYLDYNHVFRHMCLMKFEIMAKKIFHKVLKVLFKNFVLYLLSI